MNEFKYIEKYNITGRGTVYSGFYPDDFSVNPEDTILIDGKMRKIRAIEHQAVPRPLKAGDMIGILVYETREEKTERTFDEIDEFFNSFSEEEKTVNCQICNDTKVELVYGGHGNILEFPCSMCCEKGQ